MTSTPDQPSPAPRPEPPKPARRSAISQTILILLALTIGILAAKRFYAPRPVRLTPIRTEVLPAQPSLIVTTFRIDNLRPTPITLNDITLTLIIADGTRTTVSQLSHDQLPQLEASNPALALALTSPIFRNSQVAPLKSLQGTAVFLIRQPTSAWQTRRNATLTINFNHTESTSTRIH